MTWPRWGAGWGRPPRRRSPPSWRPPNGVAPWAARSGRGSRSTRPTGTPCSPTPGPPAEGRNGSGAGGGPGGPHVVGPLVGLDPDVGAGVGGVDHHAVADVDAVVADGRRGPEEDQVAGLEGGTGGQLREEVVLVLGHPGQAEAGGEIGLHDQAGAVEAGGPGAAVDVGLAQLGSGV